MSNLRYGARPPKNAPMLQLKPLLTGKLPVIPERIDYLTALAGKYKMLGNGPDPEMPATFTGAGCCEAARWANNRFVITSALTNTPNYPPLDQVWALYKTQNPGFDPLGDPDVDGPGSSHDGGMDSQTLAEYLHTTGGPDGVKLAFFAKVDPQDEAEVDAATALFGALWLDVAVQAAQQDQFAKGEPWDWIEGSEVEGLHAILDGGYSPDTNESGDAVTWAQIKKLTDRYRIKGSQQILIPVWPEHLGTKAFLEGIDQEVLAQAYQTLTGRPFHG